MRGYFLDGHAPQGYQKPPHRAKRGGHAPGQCGLATGDVLFSGARATVQAHLTRLAEEGRVEPVVSVGGLVWKTRPEEA